MITTRCGDVTLPVGKILCVGRNYAAHAAEMNAPPPGEPMLFLKPSTALLPGGGEVSLPTWSEEVHHEVEMVVRIGRGGASLSEAEAAVAVDAVAVGLDLTARDVQARAKQAGHPWSVAKGFDGSAPISELHPVSDLAVLGDLELALDVNGVSRQRGRTSAMSWPVASLVRFASTRMRLEPGDLLFTGTPEGVGALADGDRLEARLGDELGVSVLCRHGG